MSFHEDESDDPHPVLDVIDDIKADMWELHSDMEQDDGRDSRDTGLLAKLNWMMDDLNRALEDQE